ncbi:hypothetical protein [Kitasatospora sp. NPDC057015]|uniref:hypothetical protein n=1 Tax=Kitasatospora sp. NPDC057015 TaxID=3346001 RepID=UPI00362ED5AE
MSVREDRVTEESSGVDLVREIFRIAVERPQRPQRPRRPQSPGRTTRPGGTPGGGPPS